MNYIEKYNKINKGRKKEVLLKANIKNVDIWRYKNNTEISARKRAVIEKAINDVYEEQEMHDSITSISLKDCVSVIYGKNRHLIEYRNLMVFRLELDQALFDAQDISIAIKNAENSIRMFSDNNPHEMKILITKYLINYEKGINNKKRNHDPRKD